ncbi:MAG: hypothetical protein RhofKO_29600 [Rhodothermales bacterium]
MKTVTMRTLLLLATCLLSSTAIAQLRPQLDLNFATGMPQNEFNEALDAIGWGGNIFVGVGLGQSPMTVGAEFGFLVYGHEGREAPFSNTIPDVTVDVTTTNSMANGHFVLRLQPANGPVRPYVDGLVGFKYFSTTTSIEDQFDYDEPIASSTNFDDIALSYGVGGGVQVPLYTGPFGDDGSIGTVALNLGARFLWGGEAEYLRRGAIERGDGSYTVFPTRSTTDLLIPQLGVSFHF